MTSPKEITERFSFHPGTDITAPKHDLVRIQLRQVALWVNDEIPESREKSLALTALQEAMHWCNSAIAIHTKPEPLRDGRDEA